jgi:hypothetical protein
LNAMVILTLTAAMLWLSPRLWRYLRAGGMSSEPRPSEGDRRLSSRSGGVGQSRREATRVNHSWN